MFFWKKRKDHIPDLDRAVLIRGARQLAFGNDQRMETRRPLRRTWEPRGLNRGLTRSGSATSSSFSFTGHNRGEFYRWMRDSIPIISAGVWAWVRLCSTKTTQLIEGGEAERQQAEFLLDGLDSRILEMPFGRGSGLTKLTEAYFLELFTTGKFAGEAILREDGKGIDHFRFVDPYRVGWEHGENGWIPFYVNESESVNEKGNRPGSSPEIERLNPKTFFYGTLGTDITNPSGIEPLGTIPFVAEIEQLMLEDMARSSHNAGTPRLQIKVGRPPRLGIEDDVSYTDRANRFFESLVGQFQNLEPDDNIFTWNDVEVTVVGGSGKQWDWRLNREQVVEDVITGLKLFPWVLGRTHKTTQNWVQSQFDLLMLMVEAHQKSGADLINWLCNLELELAGSDAVVHNQFARNPDPFRLERAQASKVELETIDLMVEKGYMTKEDAVEKLKN